MLGRRGIQCLCVGVGHNEIYAFNLGIDHIGDRVSAGPADADYCDFRLQLINHGRTDIDAHDFIPLPNWRLEKTYALLTQIGIADTIN